MKNRFLLGLFLCCVGVLSAHDLNDNLWNKKDEATSLNDFVGPAYLTQVDKDFNARMEKIKQGKIAELTCGKNKVDTNAGGSGYSSSSSGGGSNSALITSIVIGATTTLGALIIGYNWAENKEREKLSKKHIDFELELKNKLKEFKDIFKKHAAKLSDDNKEQVLKDLRAELKNFTWQNFDFNEFAGIILEIFQKEKDNLAFPDIGTVASDTKNDKLLEDMKRVAESVKSSNNNYSTKSFNLNNHNGCQMTKCIACGLVYDNKSGYGLNFGSCPKCKSWCTTHIYK